MGYDVHRFVGLSPDIADHFKCAICLDIFEAPLELPCGHIYCLECIRSCNRNGRSAIECPECRARIEFREVKPPNRKLLGLLHNLTIKCDFADQGCTQLIKVENLLVHARQCRFNRSSLRRHQPSAPSSENETTDGLSFLLLLEDLFSDNSIDYEQRRRLQAVVNSYVQDIIEADTNRALNDERTNDYDLLINDVRLGERVRGWISWSFWSLLVLSITAASIAAIVISALKLHSCNQVATLPPALMALGISMFLSVILETTRIRYYADKVCIGLKFIELFALGSLSYLAVVTYSNLDYTTKSMPSNSTLTCDGLVFGFAFWFVSGILFLIFASAAILTMRQIYDNLKTIWAGWHGSYVLLVFIYSIPIVSLVMSIATMTIASIYIDSCDAIPSLTTRLVVFGILGVVCWLIMLLISDYKKFFFVMFLGGLLISFMCLAVTVHQNFIRQLTLLQYASNESCNVLYTYAFVVVCINYVIIGSAFLMYSMYGGICSFLFFR